MSRQKKYLTEKETSEIIKKLKATYSINAIRGTTGHSLSVINRVCKEANYNPANRQSRKGTIADNFKIKFTKNSQAGNCYIRRCIKTHNLIPYDKCHQCGVVDWVKGPLNLELDHIDGDNKNNTITNLRFLCPNCHSQTETFKGKGNTGKKKVSDEKLVEALTTENNIRQALIRVGLTPKGANYDRAYKLLHPYQFKYDSSKT
jgi:Zn finger protein HypA/HybF involved in hydrogenase expression